MRYWPMIAIASCASPPETRIREVLDSQVAAWNRGDLEAFMEGYWKSEELVFRSGDREHRGWQATLDRYKKAYDSREKMGRLSFSDLKVRMVGETEAEVTGAWRLDRAKDAPSGRFTLLFLKLDAGWRIVRDETISTP